MVYLNSIMQKPVKSDMLQQKPTKMARMERSLHHAIFLLLASFIMPAIAASEATPTVSAGELAESIARIEGSIVRLQDLANQTQQSAPLDAEALEFRLDQRIIRLMNDVTRLVRHAVSLPYDNPERNALEERLGEDLADTDQLLFQRMEALQARYALSREKLQTAE
jgi:small conductance mechanosensitive channel